MSMDPLSRAWAEVANAWDWTPVLVAAIVFAVWAAGKWARAQG